MAAKQSKITATLIAWLAFVVSLPLLAEDAMVWQVTDGQHSLYLVGTIHVLRDEDLPLPALLDRVYEQSHSLALETDLGAAQSAAFIQKLQQQSVREDGKSLQQRLSPATWERLQRYSRERGIPLQMLQPLKTGMAVLTLLSMELQRAGVDAQGVDLRYYQRALADQRELLWLESNDEQLKTLLFTDEQEHDSYVQQTLDDLQSLPQTIETMISAWREGDQAVLLELLIEPLQQQNPVQYQALLARRNHNWVALLMDWLKTPQTEMVLVGAAHLLGEDSVQALLRKKGLRVERLRP